MLIVSLPIHIRMPEEQKDIVGGNRDDASTDSSESRTGDRVSSLLPRGCVMARSVQQRVLKDTKSITG